MPKCTANTRTGQACNAWAVKGTDPPLCAPHGGVARPPGAPLGNDNATTHGVYSTPDAMPADLDAIIRDLESRLNNLNTYIDDHADEITWDQRIEAISLQGQIANRIGRLLRDRQQLTGEQDDELQTAINEAISAVGAILDIDR